MLFAFILLLSILSLPSKVYAVIEAKTFVSKKSIYDFQSLFLTIRLDGDYDSIATAGYLDETLLNDFDIKNVSVSTSSYLLNNGRLSYRRIMRYEIVPIRSGKNMIPSISILYEDGGRDGYISTEAMAVRVYSKTSLALHLLLLFLAISVVVIAIVAIILAIRNARKNSRLIEE